MLFFSISWLCAKAPWELGKEMLRSKCWLLWCQCATRCENPKLQNSKKKSEVQRGVCSALCTSGVRRKLAAKFPTFSDIFRTPCFTVFDVQDVRNTMSDNFRILPKICRKFRHCGGLSEGLRGVGFWNLLWCSRVCFGRHAWTQISEELPQGSKRRGTWARENQVLRNYPFSNNPFLQLLNPKKSTQNNKVDLNKFF